MHLDLTPFLPVLIIENYAVAELTTAYARQTLIELEQLAESQKHGLNVIYGDTDSIMVQADESKVNEFLADWSKQYPDISVESKGKYAKMLLGKKKHYLLIPFDYPNSLAIIKGFEGKKSDKKNQAFTVFIDDYARGNDPTANLAQYRLQLEKGQVPADLLSTTIVLHKNPDQYSKGHVQNILGAKLGLGKNDTLTYWLGVDRAYESDPEHYSCAECLDKFDKTFDDLVNALPGCNYKDHVIKGVEVLD